MFDVIPTIVRKDTNLQMGSRLLMGIIIGLNNSPIGCIAKDKYFAKELGLNNTRSIQRYLKELSDNEYISIEKIPRENGPSIRLIVPIWTKMPTLESKKIDIRAKESVQKKKRDRGIYEPDWVDEILNEL